MNVYGQEIYLRRQTNDRANKRKKIEKPVVGRPLLGPAKIDQGIYKDFLGWPHVKITRLLQAFHRIFIIASL